MNTESDQNTPGKGPRCGPTCTPGLWWQRAFSVTGICLFLSAVTLLCYWPVAHHPFINFDDPQYITQNLHVQAGLTSQSIPWAFRTAYICNWHPLTWISHMLDYELYGLNAGGHHFTSLLLHLANALLLFLLLNRLTQARWRSALVAALFAWHPLHVESVAWAAERKDVLSTFFFLLALGAYASYVEAKAKGPKTHSSFHYFLALSMFALGLMSKPMVVTLPFVLLLLDYWPLARIDLGVRSRAAVLGGLLFEKTPFFLLAAGASVLTFLIQRSGGAVSSVSTIPLLPRINTALIGYTRYLLKTLWPSDLSPFYPYQAHWPFGWVLLAVLLLVSLTFACLLAGKRNPYAIVGWLWFLGTLVPVIGLVQVGSQSLADRYMYIPSIGLFVLLVWGLCDLGNSLSIRPQILAGAGATALAGCLVTAELQLQYWNDGVSLFQHALAVTGENYVACNYLGKAYDDRGQKNLALNFCAESVRLAPHYVEGQYNLGTLLLDSGKVEAAITCLQQAITDDPRFVRGYNNLGKAMLLQGRLKDAIDRFSEAVRLDPDWPEAHYNLGTALLTDAQPAQAGAEFSQAIVCNPNYADAHMNWGVALMNLGKTNEGLAHFAEAVRLAPNNPEAHFNFGLALLNLKQPAQAAAQFSDGLRLRPDDARMKAHLDHARAQNDLSRTDKDQRLPGPSTAFIH